MIVKIVIHSGRLGYVDYRCLKCNSRLAVLSDATINHPAFKEKDSLLSWLGLAAPKYDIRTPIQCPHAGKTFSHPLLITVQEQQ